MLLGILQGGADGHGDQVLLGHHVAHLGHRVLDEAHVAVGDDADELVAFDHGQAGNAVFAHDHQGVLDGHFRRHGDGSDDHAGFGLLDLLHLDALAGDAHVLVDDAHATAAGQGNGHAGFGDRVHGRADQGNVEADFRGQPRGHIGRVGQNLGIPGDEKDVVKSETKIDDFFHCVVLRVIGSARIAFS